MIDVYKLAANLSFRTSLLESLEWDEDLLQTFLLYFDDKMRQSSNIDEVLLEIKDCFGEDCHDIVIKIFREEASKLEVYIDNDREH
jgi:hypothetical protein